MATAQWKKWLAIGAGVGIEIHGDDLRVIVSRVRPSGTRVLGMAEIADFRSRPAAEWGREYEQFLRKTGGTHLAATVLLPRHEVIVRQVQMPGVADRDLNAALALQIDSLHPYAEDEAQYSWARIGKTSTILVGIARRETIEAYHALFREAGVKVAAFTFSAAAIYSSLRLYAAPADGLLAMQIQEDGAEFYGESSARPVFSAFFDESMASRAIGQALAELRLPPELDPAPLDRVLPEPKTKPAELAMEPAALSYAASLAGAVPRLGLPINLLPENARGSNSRLRYVPTIVLSTVLLGLTVLWGAQDRYENRRYIALLEQEIARYEPQARKVAAIDKDIAVTQQRTQMLDGFRRHSKADLDALNELTKMLPPPGWVQSLELARNQVTLTGESEQASGLLKTLDSSPYFSNSEFLSGVVRNGNMETFRIKAQRKGANE